MVLLFGVPYLSLLSGWLLELAGAADQMHRLHKAIGRAASLEGSCIGLNARESSIMRGVDACACWLHHNEIVAYSLIVEERRYR